MKLIRKQAAPRATEKAPASAPQAPGEEEREQARGDKLRVHLRVPEPMLAWMPPLAYLVLALYLTWPWIESPETTVLAPIGGDVSTSIAKWEAINEAGVVPFVNDRIASIGFPDGVATMPGLDIVSAFSTLYLWVGSVALGPVAAHGLLAVLGFLLTATVTYFFVRKVTGSAGAGFVAGLAYGFSPHLSILTRVATTYTQMWLFMLPLWAFWNLSQSPGRRTALVAGASLVPAMFWTPYYTLHVLAVGTACFLVVAVLSSRIGLRRPLLALVVAPPALAALAYLAVGAVTSFSGAPDRPLTDFYEQGAHPLMFVWPGFSSVWGNDVADTLAGVVPRARGANLYVGLSVVALGAVGAWTALRPWASKRLRGRPSPQALAALLALSTLIITFLGSMPPHVLDGSVPMPSSLIYEVAPGLRSGQRFVMPLMAGTSVLAGLGTAAILRRLPRAAIVPATLAIAFVVALDLHTRLPPEWLDRVPARSPALESLAKAPDGPVFHILPGYVGGASQRACLVQMFHHKTLVDVCGLGTPSARLLHIGGLPICRALVSLRRSGLRYVLTEGPPPPRLVSCFRRRLSSPGAWRVLAHDDAMWVVELVPSRP